MLLLNVTPLRMPDRPIHSASGSVNERFQAMRTAREMSRFDRPPLRRSHRKHYWCRERLRFRLPCANTVPGSYAVKSAARVASRLGEADPRDVAIAHQEDAIATQEVAIAPREVAIAAW
jgi:hypothetical protein